jgi:hypothetical protein
VQILDKIDINRDDTIVNQIRENNAEKKSNKNSETKPRNGTCANCIII